MPQRHARPRHRSSPQPPSLRLCFRLNDAAERLRECLPRFRDRLAISAGETLEIREVLELCRRAMAREMAPAWLRHLPTQRAFTPEEAFAVLRDAARQLEQVRQLWSARTAALDPVPTPPQIAAQT